MQNVIAEWSREAIFNGEDGWELGVRIDYIRVAALDMALRISQLRWFFFFLLNLKFMMMLYFGYIYIERESNGCHFSLCWDDVCIWFWDHTYIGLHSLGEFWGKLLYWMGGNYLYCILYLLFIASLLSHLLYFFSLLILLSPKRKKPYIEKKITEQKN